MSIWSFFFILVGKMIGNPLSFSSWSNGNRAGGGVFYPLHITNGSEIDARFCPKPNGDTQLEFQFSFCENVLESMSIILLWLIFSSAGSIFTRVWMFPGSRQIHLKSFIYYLVPREKRQKSKKKKEDWLPFPYKSSDSVILGSSEKQRAHLSIFGKMMSLTLTLNLTLPLTLKNWPSLKMYFVKYWPNLDQVGLLEN